MNKQTKTLLIAGAVVIAAVYLYKWNEERKLANQEGINGTGTGATPATGGTQVQAGNNSIKGAYDQLDSVVNQLEDIF